MIHNPKDTKENRVKSNSLSLLVCPPFLSHGATVTYRDTFCTYKNMHMLVLSILLIYLILYLKVDGSALNVPMSLLFSFNVSQNVLHYQ